MKDTKVKIQNNKTYYPGINHIIYDEMELDEYIWLIHSYIDNIIDDIFFPAFSGKKVYHTVGDWKSIATTSYTNTLSSHSTIKMV